MNEIYIIESCSSEPYEHWSHPVGWVTTEAEAKKAVKDLTAAISKCPVKKRELDAFENALAEWEEIASPIYDDLWAKNPYKDDSEFHRPTDIEKYNEYNDGVEKIMLKKRADWFEQNHPQWAGKLDAYDEWDTVRYDVPIYSYYKVEKYGCPKLSN